MNEEGREGKGEEEKKTEERKESNTCACSTSESSEASDSKDRSFRIGEPVLLAPIGPKSQQYSKHKPIQNKQVEVNNKSK